MIRAARASASAVTGAGGARGSGAAAKAAVEAGFIGMKGTSGEPERVEPRGALSRPQRLKPVPAILSLLVIQYWHVGPFDQLISLKWREAVTSDAPWQ
jgi:hypothetical protein